MKTSIEEQIKNIKRAFPSMMNGVAAQSMREKGINYHVNWGIALTDLQQLAQQYTPDTDLAINLWKDDVRECKIMALLLMPHEEMKDDLAELWMTQFHTPEMAELAAYFLFQHVTAAPQWAMRWIASDNELMQICGYHILSRAVRRGAFVDRRDRETLLDQAKAVVEDADNSSLTLRKAANNCLLLLEETAND